MTGNGFVDFNQGKLYFEVTGRGEPIIFIHGFTLDHRMWQPQVDFFQTNYQVITYDARGFGKSSVPTGPYNHGDDLKAILDQLDIESAHIIGLSMGGRIAINFALTYPGMVRSLTLMDAALDGFKNIVDWKVYFKARVGGIEIAKVNWYAHELFKNTAAPVMSIIKPIVADYSGWHWLNKDSQKPQDTKALRRLGEIHAPTLIIVGELDLKYFRQIAEALAGGIKGSKKVIIPGIGHMSNLEAPIESNELISSLLKS